MKKFLTNLFKKTKIEAPKQNILIFCGAGISAESGLTTFRDTEGLWNNFNIDEVCNIKNFSKNRSLVFQFYNNRKSEIQKALPNVAHETIANIQKKYGIENVKIFTSNIDNLLEMAGCKNVCHVHGNYNEMKCIDCTKVWSIGSEKFDILSLCPQCFSRNVKPNIIFFHENAPKHLDLIKHFTSSGEIINEKIVPNIKLFVGSSFKVIKTDMLLPMRGRSILVDLNPNQAITNQFEVVFEKKATIGTLEAEKLINDWYE